MDNNVAIQRLDWIDRLKGFAIFLMVMGHVIAWSFDSFDTILASSNKDILVVWKFVYSFHMPLFMFCSGFLFFKGFEWFTVKNVGSIIWKRVQSLLVPYVCAGLLIFFYDGSEYKYWFLWYLFIFSVFTAVLFLFFSVLKIPYKKIVVSITLVVISLVCYKLGGGPLFDDHLNFYLYFSLGIIYKMWKLEERFLSNNLVYTISIILFSFLFCLNMRGIGNIWMSMIISIAGINIFLIYFKNHFHAKHKIWERLGKSSLQIYIIHFFFTVNIPSIGRYIIETQQQYGIASVVVIELVTSFFISVLIVVLCFLVSEVIGKSDILSRVFLGRSSKTA